MALPEDAAVSVLSIGSRSGNKASSVIRYTVLNQGFSCNFPTIYYFEKTVYPYAVTLISIEKSNGPDLALSFRFLYYWWKEI